MNKILKRSVDMLNKPWNYSKETIATVAISVLDYADTAELAQEVLKSLDDKEALQKYVKDALRYKVLKKDLMYHTLEDFQKANIKQMAAAIAKIENSNDDSKQHARSSAAKSIELKANDNIEDNQIQFIGYYSDGLSIAIEREKVEEAAVLANRLHVSMKKMCTANEVKNEILQELSNSILLFKNKQKKLFAFDPKNRTALLTDVYFNHDMLQRIAYGYLFPYFTPGEPFITRKQEGKTSDMVEHKMVNLEVLKVDVDVEDGKYYYVVSYGGTICRIKMLPYEVTLYSHDKIKPNITCVYKGLNDYGNPILIQDRASQIKELYEENTMHVFTYLYSRKDFTDNREFEYHVLEDEFGLHHRFYNELTKEQRTSGAKIQVYIKGISAKSGNLILAIYDPTIERHAKEWYDAQRVFGEINETGNQEDFFDAYLKKDSDLTELDKDLQSQYKEESNLWLFTYLNILDREIISGHIRRHEIEELDIACNLMIKLQKWMVEGSCFLDLFSEDTKEDIIAKSTHQIQKFQRMSLAIDFVRNSKQDEYVIDIVTAIEKSGRIAIKKEERMEVLICILRIYPGYLLQDIERTCRLLKAILTLGETLDEYYLATIKNLLDVSIESNVAKIRKSSFRTNDIDITQTVKLYEVLSLLIAKVIIYSDEKYKDELEARTAKARFFRYLSLLTTEDKQAAVVKAGVDSLVGILNDENIFTWENAIQINIVSLVGQTLQATVLDSNADNDYCYYKEEGKSGVVLLDATGFTVVPYRQCISSFTPDRTLVNFIRPIHHLETLPVKIGSMYNIPELTLTDDAVGHYDLWHRLSKSSAATMIELDKPKVGDKVRVVVKEQSQKDHLKSLLFVRVEDPNFETVDGVIIVSEISSKWISDARIVFKKGDSFYAKVKSVDDGRYSFSIKEDMDQLSTSYNVQDDIKNILLQVPLESSTLLPKDLLQELALLIDMRIRKESSPRNRYSLIGYAYCLCALISDPKSYYYDFMLRYYARVEQFLSNSRQDVNIEFHDTIDDNFPDLPAKRKFIELLNYASSGSEKGIAALQALVKEANNDASRLAATILSFIYAQKAGFDNDIVASIRTEIRKNINAAESLNLSSLEQKSNKSTQDESDNIAIADDSDENDTIISEKGEGLDTEDTVNQPKDVVPVDCDLVFYADSTMSLTEHKANAEISPDIIRIHLPITGDNYKVLIMTSDYKFYIVNPESMNYGMTEPSRFNSYRIKSYFVVLGDSMAGITVNTRHGEYITLQDIEDIEGNMLLSNDFATIDIMYCQPFILPAGGLLNETKLLAGTMTKVDDVSEVVVTDLQNYGIFIR